MKTLVMGLAVLPLFAGVAVAAQPLTDRQMDRVTAGFTALSIADATGLVDKGQLLATAVTSLSQVLQDATAKVGEVTITAILSNAAASSSSASSAIPTVPLP